jgi:hypothetical protein
MNYKRFFAFGCSFTQYHWATWADLIHFSYPDVEYYNLGLSGGGNNFILNRVMQADETYNFTKEDLVIVQWTNVAREDRWVINKDGNGHWTGTGNIYNCDLFDDNYIQKYTCPEGFLLRDLAAIKAVQTLLKYKQCTYYQLSMVPITQWNQYKSNSSNNNTVINNLLHRYSNTLSVIRPDYFTVIFNRDWRSRTNRPLMAHTPKDNKYVPHEDLHPTPTEHCMYLKSVLPEIYIKSEVEQAAALDTARLCRELSLEESQKQGSLSGYFQRPFKFNNILLKRDKGSLL